MMTWSIPQKQVQWIFPQLLSFASDRYLQIDLVKRSAYKSTIFKDAVLDIKDVKMGTNMGL